MVLPPTWELLTARLTGAPPTVRPTVLIMARLTLDTVLRTDTAPPATSPLGKGTAVQATTRPPLHLVPQGLILTVVLGVRQDPAVVSSLTR